MVYSGRMITFKLKEFLEEHDLSAYKLGQAVEGISEITVRKYAAGERQPQLESLDAVITALRALTGKDVTPGDLLEYRRG